MPVVRAGALDIAFEAHGPPNAEPVVLLHGFPDDVRVWDGVIAGLTTELGDFRVIVPWLRGYGATRFIDPQTPRSGQQAALAADLLALLDALAIPRARLAGYDWGGRAACIVSALHPDRVERLVTIGGYNIQDIAHANAPASVTQELRFWYQWYFATPRGEAGLAANRQELARLLWRMWSPNWPFDNAVFAETAASWDNPDYVAVVIHSYRHRYGLVAGDPAYDAIEQRLAEQPPITVPTVNLHGDSDGVDPLPAADTNPEKFIGPYRRVVVPGAGHFLPREAPHAVIAALCEPI